MRVSSACSETGDDADTRSEGGTTGATPLESENSERPTGRERPVRKSLSEGMSTLREGAVKDLGNAPWSQSAEAEAEEQQDWQTRWRRQSLEDPERGEEAETEAASQEERPLGDGQELASEVKLVSIPQTEVPVLPAPGEARRSTVSRSSVASQVSRIESLEESLPYAEQKKEVPQLPTPVESSSARRKTIVGVPGEVLPRDLKEKLMSMATTPEGPRVESRHAERVSEVRPEDGIGRQREAEVVSRQSPERYTEKVEKAPSSSPKKKFSTKSRSTSFIDGEEKRGIRAEGLQELLQEVYDKFRRCSAQLREADRGQLLVPGSNAGAEDTDLGDTWQEVEWLRQAVVGMHSHLLLAQKRQHVLEKKCKEFQEKIAEARSGGVSAKRPADHSTLSAPKREESPAGVALANMPCSYTINHTTSTPRGRPPVTVQPPAQIRAASAPQVGLHQRQMLPKSHASASELALASPRWTGQAAQTYVPVYAASPNFLPLASRRIPMTSFEGSTIFFPSPQSAGTESPAQGVRAWLSSPRLAPATPVPPLTPPVPLTPLASPRLGTPRLAPRCAPVTAPVTASPAATPPVPGPGLGGLLYGSLPAPNLQGSWSVPHASPPMSLAYPSLNFGSLSSTTRSPH